MGTISVCVVTFGVAMSLIGISLLVSARHLPRWSPSPKPPGPDRSIWINLDILRQIESGGNASAVSPRGARGPYQFTRPAWEDAAKSIRDRGAVEDPCLPYDRWVTDETVSRAMAWEYVAHVLPDYLTAQRLGHHDETVPVPDSLDARLAAWNAGALAVRRAYTKSPANWPAHLPFETREFIGRYHHLLVQWGGPAAVAHP